MSNINFEKALSESVLKEAAKEYEAEFCDEAAKKFGEKEFEFSENHNKKMQKLFAKQSKKTWRMLKGIAGAAAVLVICFTAAMQVEAVSVPVKDALFGHPAVVKSEQRTFDVYHPEYYGPPIAKFTATVTFEFTGQNAKITLFDIDKTVTEDHGLEVEYVVSGDTVQIVYECKDTRDMATIKKENPTTIYTEYFEEWVGVSLVKETLTLTVTPDGNINGFI